MALTLTRLPDEAILIGDSIRIIADVVRGQLVCLTVEEPLGVIVLREELMSGEAILIGDSIRIIVKRVRGKLIFLAVEAPPEVVILREELVLPTATDN